MPDAFEKLLTMHCSPTLAGIKPASLFTWHTANWEQDRAALGQYAKKLLEHGLQVEILCECEKYFLVFLYRFEALGARLSCPAVRAFLRRCGYSRDADLRGCLDTLKTHFGARDLFPHEIGIFLGYPLEDVVGFIQNGGEKCKCCGYWKVYGDEQTSRDTFARYDKCRRYFENKRAEGYRIEEILTRYPIPA